MEKLLVSHLETYLLDQERELTAEEVSINEANSYDQYPPGFFTGL